MMNDVNVIVIIWGRIVAQKDGRWCRRCELMFESIRLGFGVDGPAQAYIRPLGEVG